MERRDFKPAHSDAIQLVETATKSALQLEEEKVVEELPFRLGPNGGIFLTGLDPKYKIITKNFDGRQQIMDSSERKFEVYQSYPDRILDVDPTYEYGSKQLLFEDAKKYLR